MPRVFTQAQLLAEIRGQGHHCPVRTIEYMRDSQKLPECDRDSRGFRLYTEEHLAKVLAYIERREARRQRKAEVAK